jgi:hypothetical protein
MHKVPDGHNPLSRSRYCGDPGALVSFLYNDGSVEELAAIAEHVQACDTCTRELAALSDTRDVLSTWSPPQTELGFTLASSDVGPVPAAFTSEPVAAAPVPWWRQATPVWMQAVAATVVFGAGLAVGTASRGASPAAAPAGATTAAAVSRGELSAMEERLRAEFAKLAAPVATAPVATTADADHEQAIMRRVVTMLNESEERQRRELAMRTTQVLRDIEIQRKVDMATVQQNIGQIQGVTGAELQRQRELYNMLMNNASLRGGQR